MPVNFYVPSPSLRFLIKRYVYYDINEKERMSFLPSGYPFLSINFGDEYMVYNKKHPGDCFKTHYFVGNTKTSYAVLPKGQFKGLGIHFEPVALCQLLRLSLNEITDTAVPVDELRDKDYLPVIEKVIRINDIPKCISTLEKFFLGKSLKSEIGIIEVDCAIDYLRKSRGNIHISDIADKLCISTRSLERKFMQYVGLTPKQFAKIIRLNGILNLVGSAGICKLTDIAYQFGYFDQMHFIKDFKSYIGENPASFMPKPLPVSYKFNLVS